MEKTLIFSSASEVRFRAVLRFIVPTYLTFLFNTLYRLIVKSSWTLEEKSP